MGDLPTEEQEVCLLRQTGEMTYEAIAEALEIFLLIGDQALLKSPGIKRGAGIGGGEHDGLKRNLLLAAEIYCLLNALTSLSRNPQHE